MPKQTKVILTVVILAVVVILSFAVFALSVNSHSSAKSQITVGNKILNIEIAQTASQITKGLSGRQGLAENSGMLFVFADKNTRTFWMKDMNFPLDMIWLSDNKIVGIEKNVPVPVSQASLPLYQSPSSVNYVLEVNAGWADKNGVKIGDEVELPND